MCQNMQIIAHEIYIIHFAGRNIITVMDILRGLCVCTSHYCGTETTAKRLDSLGDWNLGWDIGLLHADFDKMFWASHQLITFSHQNIALIQILKTAPFRARLR